MDTIQVLLLEDHEGEARLNQRLLERSYTTEFRFTSLRTLEETLAAVATQQYDVALLDLNVPDSKGMDTFLALHAATPDLPVVIISAVADEQLAQTAIRNGAQDYLVKGGITSEDLRRVVRYAIARKASERGAGQVRIERQDASLPGCASFRLTTEGTFAVVSSGLASLLGASDPHTLPGKPLSGFFPPREEARIEDAVRGVLRHGVPDLLLRALSEDEDAPERLLLTLTPVSDDAADVTAAGGGDKRSFVAVEGTAARAPFGLTPAREAAEANRRYRMLVEHSQDGVFVLSEGKIMYANHAFASMLGYEPATLAGMPMERLIAPEDHARVFENYRRRVAGEDVEDSYEVSALRADGSRVRVQISVGRLEHDGGIEIMGTIKDVTDVRRAAYLQQLQSRLTVLLSQARGDAALFEQLLQGLLRIDSIDLVAVHVIDDDGRAYRPAGWKGLEGPFPAAEEQAAFASLHDRLVREAAPRYFTEQELRTHPLAGLLSPRGIRCFGVIPVVHGESLLAAIDVASLTQHRFDESVSKAVESIASFFGGVLARVLAEDARMQSEELYRARV